MAPFFRCSYALSLHLSGLSSLAGSINVLTTILLMRGPALAMQRVPLFVWGVLITNLLLLLANPSSPRLSPGGTNLFIADGLTYVVPVFIRSARVFAMASART